MNHRPSRAAVLAAFLVLVLAGMSGCAASKPWFERKYGSVSVQDRVHAFTQAGDLRTARGILASLEPALDPQDPKEAERIWKSSGRAGTEALVEIFAFIEERSTPLTAEHAVELQKTCVAYASRPGRFYTTARRRAIDRMVSAASDPEVVQYARTRNKRLEDQWSLPPFE
jgi:hypothetical protein